MLSRILNSCDRPLGTFGKGVVLLWIVTCMGYPQQSASPDEPANSLRESTQGEDAPVSEKPELTPEKSDPITAKIPRVFPRNARVRELQEERLKVCQEMVRVIDVRIKGGVIDMGAGWKARKNLLDAQLDLAETKADRIRVYQELVEVLEANYKVVKKMSEVDTSYGTDELSARSNLLKAQIALEKEKSSPE